MPLKDKETFQYITFASIKKNYHLVFGQNNDAMAEAIFRYLSGCNKNETGLSNSRVNYLTFLQKFQCLWPKKPEVKAKNDSNKAREEFKFEMIHKQAQDRLIFNILDLDGDDQLSILDLVWICSHFNEETQLGLKMAEVFEQYMDKNVRPKYVRTKYKIDF